MVAKQKTSSTKSSPHPYKRIADELQRERRARKLSVRKAAQLSNLPEATVRALERPKPGDVPDANIHGLYRTYSETLEIPGKHFDTIAPAPKPVTPSFRLRELPKLKSLVVFSNIGTVAIVSLLILGVTGYAAWQGAGLVARPSLNITSPAQELLVVDESSIEVSGSVERESTVLINGQPTTVGSDTGDFSQLVFLQAGYNYITVEVLNSFSSSTVREFIVIYEPAERRA